MNQHMIDSLREIVGAEGLIDEPFDMQPFLKDWRGMESGSAICVVLPKTTPQVSEVVKLAAEIACPIYLQGGNTGLCFGAVPSKRGNCIIMAMGRMRQIRSIDRASNAIVVDAGAVLGVVHRAAEEIGRSFPLHLGSEGTAQIGGLIATNAGGINAMRYGTMRDLVYGLEFVLPNGEIISDLAPLRKNNIGYDLKHLQIGGEGTLGIVTAACLKLHPAILSDAHAWLSFERPVDALELLERLQDRFDTAILACELLSKSQVALVLKHIKRTRTPFAVAPEWSVLLEMGTPNGATNLRAELEEFLAENFEACRMVDVVVAQDSRQAQSFWHVRHSVSEANKLEGMGLTHDVAVSVSQVPAYLDAGAAILAEHFPSSFPVAICHLGDGNIHYIAMFSDEVWQAVADKAEVTRDVQTKLHDLAIAFGGTFSAEHGIGRKLGSELRRLINPAKYRTLLAIKSAIDPRNILNPGVLLSEQTSDTAPPVAER